MIKFFAISTILLLTILLLVPNSQSSLEANEVQNQSIIEEVKVETIQTEIVQEKIITEEDDLSFIETVSEWWNNMSSGEAFLMIILALLFLDLIIPKPWADTQAERLPLWNIVAKVFLVFAIIGWILIIVNAITEAFES